MNINGLTEARSRSSNSSQKKPQLLGLDDVKGLDMDFGTTAASGLLLAGNIGRGFRMLKIILGLVSQLPTLERDIEGVVNEIKDAPDGLSAIRNAIGALRKLADDIEKLVS